MSEHDKRVRRDKRTLRVQRDADWLYDKPSGVVNDGLSAEDSFFNPVAAYRYYTNDTGSEFDYYSVKGVRIA